MAQIYIYMDKYMAISMEYHNLEDEHERWILDMHSFFNIRDIPSGNHHGEPGAVASSERLRLTEYMLDAT